MDAQDTAIVINIDECNSYMKMGSDELIHQDVYKKLIFDIKNTILQTKVKTPLADKSSVPTFQNEYPPSSGLVYFIDGSRGAGKTTFLRTVYENLPFELSQTDINSTSISISKLDYIDPTRLEACENLLLNVLRALKVAVDNSYLSLDNEPLKNNFRQAFKKLAGGLSLFRNGHDQLAHLDPELFFDRGLTQAEDSRSLRKYFHQAIDIACHLLNTDTLMLAFDDADTNAQHAFPLLECIRNYLDSPRLLILVTGDMELYSLLVRDEFSQRLPSVENKNNSWREEQRLRMLDHLEDQYVLKLFPLSRRQHLKTLNRLFGKMYDGTHPSSYKICSSRWNDVKRDPIKVLDEIISRGLRIASQSDIELFRTHLLKQPLRSILQVLQGCAPHLSKSDDDINNTWNRDLSDALRESLRAMAQGSLYKYGVVVDDLTANYLPTLSKAVFDLCCQDGDVDTAAYLRPQASNDDLNNCYLALAAEVAGQCAESASASIKYMLTGPGNVTLWGKEKRRMSDNMNQDLLYRQFSQYMAIGRNEDALNWARRATAVLAARHPSQAKAPVIDFGIIGLNKREPDEARGKGEGFSTIDSILSINYSRENKAYPTLAYSLLDVSSQSSRCYSSIYNILGLVERLFGARSHEEVSRRLKSTYPQLSISSPDWGGSIDTMSSEDNPHTVSDDTVKDSDNSELEGDLINSILAWQELNKESFKEFSPSSVLLGKIWIRIYFSLEKSSDRIRPGLLSGGRNVDDIMEINAACLINAFLVEEADHNLLDYSISPDRTNPLTSAFDILKKKKDFLKKNKSSLPLTTLISSCPIVLGLLKKESRIIIKEALSLDDTITNIPSAELPVKAFIAGRWRKTEAEPKSRGRTKASTKIGDGE
ncbi:hypothetical protein [Enterobacter hormaechei]|uniref:hypothetical protein n=1 Tax=Enterobacter hormaechei TaxID=158836 RepID=UPI0013FD27D9|nr:hypothetical protein [Enterobacter hormaechei]